MKPARRRGRSIEKILRAYPPPDVNQALRNLQYVVVDVETTGGPAERGHRITELCAVRVTADGQVLDELNTLVNPERPIPAAITRLTNINSAMVRDAPRFSDIAPDLYRIVSGGIFVAHNAGFDWNFLGWELERVRHPIPRSPVLCTVRLAKKLVPEVRSKSLDALSFYFNIHNEARHRAFGDARATARVLRFLLERAYEHDVSCWVELEELLRRRAPRRKKRASPESLGQIQLDMPSAPELEFDAHPSDDAYVTDAPALKVAEPQPAYAPQPSNALNAAIAFLNRLVEERKKQ